ncbi:MAG TPA: ABC-three component system protein [Mucilaginibacter sp.]|jgi:hypothetical protein
MTTPEIYFARKLFQLEIYKRKGQDFENLFTRVIQLSNPAFTPVTPQGRYGDRKNDGFIKASGKYYQVYSPADPSQSEKNAIDKLAEDFDGLYKYWNDQVTPIREFYYVINDKYQGCYPTVFPELKKIENQYPGVKCHPFLTSQLEDLFLALPDNDQLDIIGFIVVPEDISLDVSVLSEVIGYLTKLEVPYSRENMPKNPNFEEKIIFNSLGTDVANILRFGSYQDGALKEFFKINSTFAKNDLRNIFNRLYLDGMTAIPDTEGKNDLVFFYILDKAFPSSKKVVKDAIFVLMSYFFGYCDIFEEPLKQDAKYSQLPLF